MTDEHNVYTYQVFQINGAMFTVNAPRPLPDFIAHTMACGYVMTETDFAPYHGIIHIRIAPAGVTGAAAGLRSMN